MKFFAALLLLLTLCLPVRLMAIIGKPMPIERIPTTVIQGEAVTAWEKDKLYVFECWATWCGPCVSAMAHTEDLWQAMKAEGHYVIGLNILDRLNEQQVRDFVAQRPQPVTYPILMDKGKELKQYLGIHGIPFVFIVRNGTIVWRGHPMSLRVSMLHELIAGKTPTPPPEERAMQAAQVPAHLALERRADEALVFNRWQEAEDLQLQALRSHPLHRRLTTPYTPKDEDFELPEPRLGFQGVDLEDCSCEGDLAPYVQLLGEPLPKLDNCFTVLSYWRPDSKLTRYTSEAYAAFPGESEARVLRFPHRLKVLASVDDLYLATEQFKSAPALSAQHVTFLKSINREELFGYNEMQSGSFVAIFLSGELLYKGSLTMLPTALRGNLVENGILPSPATLKAQIAADAEEQVAIAQMLQTLRGPNAADLIPSVNDLLTVSPNRLVALMPYRLAILFDAGDVEGAVPLIEHAYDCLQSNEYGLMKIQHALNAWPALRDRMLGLYSRTVERLAEIQTQGEGMLTASLYDFAGDLANRANDPVRAQALWRKALMATPTHQRYRDIRFRCKPIPAP
jgi:thiol-disulfide isomerase/thioredoxin